MSQLPVLLATLASLYFQVQSTSFKLESMGMLVQGNTDNKTIIDHRRPITNVKTIVGVVHPG